MIGHFKNSFLPPWLKVTQSNDITSLAEVNMKLLPPENNKYTHKRTQAHNF